MSYWREIDTDKKKTTYENKTQIQSNTETFKSCEYITKYIIIFNSTQSPHKRTLYLWEY